MVTASIFLRSFLGLVSLATGDRFQRRWRVLGVKAYIIHKPVLHDCVPL